VALCLPYAHYSILVPGILCAKPRILYSRILHAIVSCYLRIAIARVQWYTGHHWYRYRYSNTRNLPCFHAALRHVGKIYTGIFQMMFLNQNLLLSIADPKDMPRFTDLHVLSTENQIGIFVRSTPL
jgi:hypothetical protein